MQVSGSSAISCSETVHLMRRRCRPAVSPCIRRRARVIVFGCSVECPGSGDYQVPIWKSPGVPLCRRRGTSAIAERSDGLERRGCLWNSSRPSAPGEGRRLLAVVPKRRARRRLRGTENTLYLERVMSGAAVILSHRPRSQQMPPSPRASATPLARNTLSLWRSPAMTWVLRSCGRSSLSPALLASSSVKA